MTGENNLRIIFRPTKEIQIRIDNLLSQGRFKTQSELIRNALWIGLNELEKQN